LKYYGLHEVVAKGTLIFKHISTGDMIADSLTEAIGREKFKALVKAIGLS
jgi:hypothetical protein